MAIEGDTVTTALSDLGTLDAGLFALAVATAIARRVPLLARLNLPIPVVGGVLVAVVAALPIATIVGANTRRIWLLKGGTAEMGSRSNYAEARLRSTLMDHGRTNPCMNSTPTAPGKNGRCRAQRVAVGFAGRASAPMTDLQRN